MQDPIPFCSYCVIAYLLETIALWLNLKNSNLTSSRCHYRLLTKNYDLGTFESNALKVSMTICCYIDVTLGGKNLTVTFPFSRLNIIAEEWNGALSSNNNTLPSFSTSEIFRPQEYMSFHTKQEKHCVHPHLLLVSVC